MTRESGQIFAGKFGERVHQIRRALGLSQADMAARLARANNSVVSRLELGTAGSINFDVLGALVAMAEQAGYSAEWLLAGRMVSPQLGRRELLEGMASKLVDELLVERDRLAPSPPAGDNIQPLAGPLRVVRLAEPGFRVIDAEQLPGAWQGGYVPVVGHLAAGEGIETTQAEQTGPGWADEYLIYDGAPAAAVAVRVVGDSMEPDYRSGDMVVVDTARPARRGVCCVLVSRDGERRARLKDLRVQGARAVLASANPDYEPETVPAADVQAFKIIAHLPLLVERAVS